MPGFDEDNTFIFLYRKLLKKSIWLNSSPPQKCILIALLLMANHAANQWERGGQEYSVQRGQFITSQNSIIKNCGKGITRQNVRTAIARFEKLDFLTIKSTKQKEEGSIITIKKFDNYQYTPNQATNQCLTNAQPMPNQCLTTNNNEDNEKNENKKESFFKKNNKTAKPVDNSRPNPYQLSDPNRHTPAPILTKEQTECQVTEESLEKGESFWDAYQKKKKEGFIFNAETI